MEDTIMQEDDQSTQAYSNVNPSIDLTEEPTTSRSLLNPPRHRDSRSASVFSVPGRDARRRDSTVRDSVAPSEVSGTTSRGREDVVAGYIPITQNGRWMEPENYTSLSFETFMIHNNMREIARALDEERQWRLTYIASNKVIRSGDGRAPKSRKSQVIDDDDDAEEMASNTASRDAPAAATGKRTTTTSGDKRIDQVLLEHRQLFLDQLNVFVQEKKGKPLEKGKNVKVEAANFRTHLEDLLVELQEDGGEPHPLASALEPLGPASFEDLFKSLSKTRRMAAIETQTRTTPRKRQRVVVEDDEEDE